MLVYGWDLMVSLGLQVEHKLVAQNTSCQRSESDEGTLKGSSRD